MQAWIKSFNSFLAWKYIDSERETMTATLHSLLDQCASGQADSITAQFTQMLSLIELAFMVDACVRLAFYEPHWQSLLSLKKSQGEGTMLPLIYSKFQVPISAPSMIITIMAVLWLV